MAFVTSATEHALIRAVFGLAFFITQSVTNGERKL